MKKLWWILLPVLSLVALLILWAGNHSPGASMQPTPLEPNGTVLSPASGGMMSNSTSMLAVRITLALALILVLIVAVVRGLRAMGWSRSTQQLDRVRVLDRCWLGPRKALYTVRIGERHVVVGVTEASIQPVLELSAQESETLFPEVDNTNTNPSFSEFLSNAVRKVGGR